MGAIVEVDELVEAAAEVMAVQLGAATATDFLDFLFLLIGAVTVSLLGVLSGGAMKFSRRRVATFRLGSKGGGSCDPCQLDDVALGVKSEEVGRASERELLTAAVLGILCSKDVVDGLATECIVDVARWQGDKFRVADPDTASESWSRLRICRFGYVLAEVNPEWNSWLGIRIDWGS